MSARDHTNGDQFFHGTAGDPTIGGLAKDPVISPANQRSWGTVTFPSDTDPDYAYATTDESSAWAYAEKAWGTRAAGIPRVFQVDPLGEHEEDPAYDQRGASRSNYQGDRRSKAGWRVVREIPMPEHMGKPEDWR